MRLMSRIALMLLLAFAATTGTAYAGGWATVELDESPSGIVAGEPWRVELLVKQHGIRPMDDISPSVRIDNGEGVVRTFRARPTGRPGTYAVEVTYPTAGTWRTRIFDGFTDAYPHRLREMEVPAGATASAGSDFPWHQTVAIAVVALLFLAGVLSVSDRPRPRLGTVTLRGRAA
jgi:hypothetical protein